jgi:polyisoprenoid-binding protein YceI
MTAVNQQSPQQLEAGIYGLDPIHSSASFAVKHMVVATFRGRFENFDATLTADQDGDLKLVGTVAANSIVVKDENLGGHLKSPDFFDTERYPEIKFESTQIRRNGDQIEVDGEMTIKGNTQPLTGRGTIVGPHEDIAGNTKVGLTLETVIDRTKYGLNWNAPLPKGGFALENDVNLTVELELAKA